MSRRTEDDDGGGLDLSAELDLLNLTEGSSGSSATSDDSSSEGDGGRGRARSGAFISLDGSEYDPSNDVDPSSASGDHQGRARTSSFDVGGTSRANPSTKATADMKAAALSKRTLKIVNQLDDKKEVVNKIKPNRATNISEEEFEERQLEEEERRKRMEKEAATAAAGPAQGKTKGKDKTAVDNTKFDVYIRILLLGDSGVGKTSAMMRYSEDKFSSSLLSTAGVDYQTRYIEVGGKIVKLQLWDTAGQERFHVITKAYYRGAHGIVLMYDVADEDSFSNVGYWMTNIQQHAAKEVEKILVGNKVDRPDKKIDSRRGQEIADEYKINFFETSCKDGTNINKAFINLAETIIRKQTESESKAGAASLPTPSPKQTSSSRDLGGKEKDKGCIIL